MKLHAPGAHHGHKQMPERMKFLHMWAGYGPHALIHGRAAESGTWPMSLCFCMAKNPPGTLLYPVSGGSL